MIDITELAQSHELLIASGQQTADLLRHLADNEIDSDYFAVVSECESYGQETDTELSITEFALRAAGYVDALVEALGKAQQRIASQREYYEGVIADGGKRIAELEESNAQVIQSRDHYKRMTEEGLKQLAESRTVKLPDELSGETLLDNYSDVVYSDDTGVLEYTNIIGCFVKITAPPDKVIRFRWSNEGMHIRLVDRVKTHEHAGIIVDFPKNNKDFIQ